MIYFNLKALHLEQIFYTFTASVINRDYQKKYHSSILSSGPTL
jgi:hypothetical protein